MAEEQEAGFETGVEINKVASGVEWVFKRDDGTCTKGWAPTEEQAGKELKEEIMS